MVALVIAIPSLALFVSGCAFHTIFNITPQGLAIDNLGISRGIAEFVSRTLWLN